MSYKPSRTREERKNAPLYIPENELRQQLEQQANLKRRQKTLESLKEKQEILDHYANLKLPGGESDSELANFLSQKQQELDVLNRQLEAQAPELYMENKEAGQREIKRKEVQAPVFSDNFFSRQQDDDSNQGRILSKGEIEREKRLKLRDEERMRRLAGVKESAYDANAKPYLPQSLPSLPGISHPAEPKEELVLPIHRKQMNMAAYEPNAMYGDRRSEFQPAFDNRSSIEMHSNMLPALDKKEAEKMAMKEMMFGNREDPFVPKKEFPASRFEDKENTPTMNMMPVQEVRQSTTSVENKLPPILSEYNKGENVANKERESQSRGGNREKVEKTAGGNDIFSKLGGGQGQGNLSEAEKKRKYKEELDAMMKMKKENSVPEGRRNSERRPSYSNMEAPRDVRSEANIDSREAPRSLPSIQGEKSRVEREAYAYPMGDRNVIDREEKKKKYAEELMQEITAKEREKERAKQEKRAQSSAAQNRMQANEGAWNELNAQNRVSESQDRSYDRGARRDELPPRAVAGGVGNKGRDEDSEMEKKRKYKEFLDAQVEERKRRDKADVEARQETRQDSRQDVYQSNQGGRGERIERMESREERPSREVERIERMESKAVSNNEAAPGGFFIHKGEDEEKQRAQLRNQQKLKMAEELKKQMEEKEEMKRKEKQKKAEEDLREKERLERDAEQEKRRQQEENQKKQQAEKKNQEYNVHPSVPETQTHHDAKPQYTHVPDDIERPGPDMGGRQAHLERAAPYNEPREDPGYQSRQNFYGGNEQYGAHNRGGYEQNMYPPQHHGHHGGYYPQENMPPPQHYNEGYGYPPHSHHMQYPRQPPSMGFEGHQQYGGYNMGGMGGNLLQEMANYNMLMQQLMEEKLKIDKIALEEQLVLEQYNNKIKEMRVEKLQYDKEIDKIKKMLHGEMPVNASVIGGMDHHMDRSQQLDVKLNALNDSYLPALMGLRNAKASHMNQYNRLLAQSQQNFSGQLRGLPNPQQGHNLGVEDTMKSQAFEDSAIFRQSLPCSSDYRPISKANLENSFQKDLKAYQEARGQNQDNNYNIESFSNRMLTDNVMQQQQQQPQQPLKKQITNLEQMLDFSTSQPNMTEIKAPVTGHEKGMMNEEFGESMILPEIEGTRAKRKIEQTPQVIYDRTPARLSQQEEAPVATHHEIFDLKPGNVSDLKMVEDISQFKLQTPKESNRHTQELGRGYQADMFKRESQVAQSYAQEPQELSLKKRLQAVSNEENLQDTLQASQTMDKPKKDAGEMEVKMHEGNAERSLILAEEEEDYNRDDFDAFVESQDQVLEELGIGYAKKGQRKASRSPNKETAPAIVEKMSKDNKQKTGEIPHMVESQSGSHEKKYGKPKTRDPFAKAMETEMSKSKVVLAERKEEQPSEFSKWNDFVMESERKERPTERRENISSVAPREDFEPIKVDESVFPEKHFEKHDETNEAYIEEDIQGSVGKKGKHYTEQFEVEEKLEENDEAEDFKYYNKENQAVNVQGRPRKTRELERLGSKNANDSQMKLQSNISPEEEDSKSFIKPISKTRNSNMDLLLGRNSESLASKREAMKAMKAMKKENNAENEKRSKNILDRLQRLLDNWGDEMNEENNENEKDMHNKMAGSEIEESSELGKVNQSRDLFKPLGIARSYSNRYSQEGEH